MTTLTDFLLARLAEEEREVRMAEVWAPSYAAAWAHPSPALVQVRPARALADIAAKRAIVERHANSAAVGCAICSEAAREDVVCVEQRILASVYADHPDFDPAWRVSDVD